MALAYLNLVPTNQSEFEAKVRKIAGRFGFNPNWLMVVIKFETGGKFLPGYYSSSGAVGLIQFTTVGAQTAGTKKEFLATLTAVQQLDYVEKYFAALGIAGKVKSLEDLYMCVFAPAFLGKPLNTVVYKSGTAAYSQNIGLDPTRKGFITVSDIHTVIKKHDTIYPLEVVGIASSTLLTIAFILFWIWRK